MLAALASFPSRKAMSSGISFTVRGIFLLAKDSISCMKILSRYSLQKVQVVSKNGWSDEMGTDLVSLRQNLIVPFIFLRHSAKSAPPFDMRSSIRSLGEEAMLDSVALKITTLALSSWNVTLRIFSGFNTRLGYRLDIDSPLATRSNCFVP